MSKKKNTLKDLDDFLKQQAATLVAPDSLERNAKGESYKKGTPRYTIDRDWKQKYGHNRFSEKIIGHFPEERRTAAFRKKILRTDHSNP